MNTESIISRLRSGITHLISDASPPGKAGLPADYNCSVHDNEREFLFAIEGTCNYMCNYSVYPCEPGTMIIFNAGVPHGHEYIQHDRDLVHLWGHLTQRGLTLGLLEVPVNGQRRDIPNGSCRMPDEVGIILEKRWDKLVRQPVITEQTVDEYLRLPLELALDEMAFMLSSGQLSKPKITFSDRIREYISVRNGRECSLELLSNAFSCTPCYLSSKFHAESGMTVKEFVTQVRLRYVRSALKRNLKQKEIAFALGFSSPASFWNWLHKHREFL